MKGPALHTTDCRSFQAVGKQRTKVGTNWMCKETGHWWGLSPAGRRGKDEIREFKSCRALWTPKESEFFSPKQQAVFEGF